MTGELHRFAEVPARHGAARPPRIRRVTLPAARQAPSLAREAAREALSSWRLAHLTDTAVLLVSELVTNAVLHARTDGTGVVLQLEVRGTWLRIEVHDADPRGPQPRTPSGLDESGFGFVLVDSLAGSWGARETERGKAVWAELDTRQDSGQRSA
jgi:anti-sigma regulatory factor (Ser/Thr protein kinase)